MHYPKFFDPTLLFIPLGLEYIKLNTKDSGIRNFRVLYVFGIRAFVGYRPLCSAS